MTNYAEILEIVKDFLAERWIGAIQFSVQNNTPIVGVYIPVIEQWVECAPGEFSAFGPLWRAEDGQWLDEALFASAIALDIALGDA